jgi:hypothetical protein
MASRSKPSGCGSWPEVSETVPPMQIIMTVAMPLPMDALPILADAIARVFGSGETSIRFDGDHLSIVSPSAGFGPRKRSRGKIPTAPDEANEMLLKSARIDDDGIELTVEDSKERVAIIADSMRLWFDSVGATNYVEQRITFPGADAEFVFTLQKAANPTPHTLRLVAEERVADVEEALRAAESTLQKLAAAAPSDEVDVTLRVIRDALS